MKILLKEQIFIKSVSISPTQIEIKTIKANRDYYTIKKIIQNAGFNVKDGHTFNGTDIILYPNSYVYVMNAGNIIDILMKKCCYLNNNNWIYPLEKQT